GAAAAAPAECSSSGRLGGISPLQSIFVGNRTRGGGRSIMGDVIRPTCGLFKAVGVAGAVASALLLAAALSPRAGAAGKTPAQDIEGARSFWSFRPVVRPEVPKVRRAEWVRNPIDAFVLAKLEEKGFSPAPPADKAHLLRRAYYDLTGLPPSPADVASFLADNSPDAYEKVIDKLLASPHYGEKWCRHWLDLVRFAETNSYERDGPKPNAWRYR